MGVLIFAFARGAVCKDDQGMLPLHLGFNNGCDGTVVLIGVYEIGNSYEMGS